MSNRLNFSITLVQGQPLTGCATLKSFTTVIFYYAGQKPPDVQRRNREKKGDKEHHENLSFLFIQLRLRMLFFVFFLKKHLHFRCSLCYSFKQKNKIKGKTLRNSRSQMFIKIAVLKNFFLNIVKKTPVLESAFNKVACLKVCIFFKKETPTQLFSCEYCEILSSSSFIERLTTLGTKFIFPVSLLRFPLISFAFLFGFPSQHFNVESTLFQRWGPTLK